MWRRGNDDGYGGVLHVLFAIALLIAIVWGVATLVAVVFPSHPVSPSLNAVMGGTMTAAFGLVGIMVARRNGNGNGGNGNGNSKRDDREDS